MAKFVQTGYTTEGYTWRLYRCTSGQKTTSNQFLQGLSYAMGCQCCGATLVSPPYSGLSSEFWCLLHTSLPGYSHCLILDSCQWHSSEPTSKMLTSTCLQTASVNVSPSPPADLQGAVCSPSLSTVGLTGAVTVKSGNYCQQSAWGL